MRSSWRKKGAQISNVPRAVSRTFSPRVAALAAAPRRGDEKEHRGRGDDEEAEERGVLHVGDGEDEGGHDEERHPLLPPRDVGRAAIGTGGGRLRRQVRA